MAANLRDDPELSPFVLSNVRLTGIRIGSGAYCSVEEVAIPGAICAAKKIHDFFQDTAQVSDAAISTATTQFIRECQLMSTLRHPHIVHTQTTTLSHVIPPRDNTYSGENMGHTSRLRRWKAHSCVFDGFARRWFSS